MRHASTLAAAAIMTASMAGLERRPDIVVVGVPSRANATPSLSADGSRVALAWGARDPTGGTEVYVATSADAGRTFGAPVRASAGTGTARLGGEMPPRVAIVGQRVDVVWTSRDEPTAILAARSLDGGRTFGAARALQQAGSKGDRGWAALAATAEGAVHAVWLDHRDGAGAHHASPERSAILYHGGAGEVEIAKGVCYCCKTSIAAGDRGRVFVAWRHVYPGNIRDIAFSLSPDGGRTFAPPTRVSEDRWQLEGCPDDGPAMSVDTAGVAHVVWPTLMERPEPHKAVFYSWTQDGRSFAPRVRITPAGRHASHPQVVAHRAGVTVLWDEVAEGVRRVVARRRSRSQRDFVPVTLSEAGVAASYPVATLAGEEIVAAWVRGGGNDSWIAVRRLPLR